MEILNLGSHRIEVRFPEKGLRKGKNPAILLNDGELIEQLNLRTERAVLVGVYPNNRLSEYTPWPEPAIRPGTPDFGGQLGQYHRELNNEILPALIDEYALDTEKLAYGGYSLGGLAATMSLWETDAIAAVFSLCGAFLQYLVPVLVKRHKAVDGQALRHKLRKAAASIVSGVVVVKADVNSLDVRTVRKETQKGFLAHAAQRKIALLLPFLFYRRTSYGRFRENRF